MSGAPASHIAGGPFPKLRLLAFAGTENALVPFERSLQQALYPFALLLLEKNVIKISRWK